MKKFTITAFALLLSASTFAQNANKPVQPYDCSNEVFVQYGQFTTTGMLYTFTEVFGVLFGLGQANFQNTILCGGLSAGYLRHVNNWLAVGGVMTADYNTGDQFNKIKGSEGKEYKYYGKYSLSGFTIMPMARAYWFKRPAFAMYSALAFGPGFYVSSTKPDASASDPASSDCLVSYGAQISPVGMEFGRGTWRGMAEIGAGDSGCAVIGVKKMF